MVSSSVKGLMVVIVAVALAAWGRSDFEYMPGVYHTAGAVSARPFDTATGIVAAYSTRKLLSAYSGSALRVRRSSDNAESDIGFDANGDLDQTALTTFIGADSGFVSVWYDQSGFSRNLTQATTTAQLRIVNAGVVDTKNSRASPYAPTASVAAYSYTEASAFITTSTIEFFQVASTGLTAYSRFLTASASGSLDYNSASSFVPLRLSNAANLVAAERSPSATTTISYATNAFISAYSRAGPTSIDAVLTAGTGTVAYTSTAFSISSLMLSREGPAGTIRSGIGYRSEFVVTNSNQTTPSTFTAEQKTYWGAS